MEVPDKQFTIDERAEGIDKARLALPDRFNLGAGKLNACCEFFQEEVLEVGLLVFDAYGFEEIVHCCLKEFAKIGKKVVEW